MKRGLCIVLVGLAAGSLALAQNRVVSQASARLSDAYIKISAQQYKEALADLSWCYDNGAKDDPKFESLRNTLVLDAIVGLCPVLPDAITLLESKREQWKEEVGDPPKVDQHFFDLLALNRALEDEPANEALLSRAATSGAIQKFSGRTITARPPAAPKSIAIRDIKSRVESVRNELAVKPCASARAKLDAAKVAAEADAKRAAEEHAKLQAQIASMREQLEKLTPEEQDHMITKMRDLVRQLRDEVQTRASQLAKEIAFYADLVKWCESQKEEKK
ncbi:MAG: hypothetical protein HRU75_01690 [Planctomycetia bacterium]|nr:MAG: hypothetical protein HRU75_01690 [Planctomycetia bacterium]